jgi:hypothetical protein
MTWLPNRLVLTSHHTGSARGAEAAGLAGAEPVASQAARWF